MMKKITNEKIIIVNTNQSSWIQPTKQTVSIREKTNQKINELGKRYYDVKNKFDSLNVHRDVLFNFGKELVEVYKNIKIGIHIQSQIKRMKDSLYCWFSEHFYDEIFDDKSGLIQRLLYLEKQNFMRTIQTNQDLKVVKCFNSKLYNKILEKNNEKEKKDIESNLIFTNIKINREIDNFDFSNMEKWELKDDIGNTTLNSNNNFDFNKILDF